MEMVKLQGSQNVSEEKANHEEEATGEDISIPECRIGNLKISFSKTPFSCNLSNQTLILSPKMVFIIAIF